MCNNKLSLIYYLYILFHNLILINNIEDTINLFLKKDLFLKKYCISIFVISERYVLILNLTYSSILFLKYFRIKRTPLSCGTWIARKYNLHIIIYVSNLEHCSQNSGEKLGFSSLDPSRTDTREIGPLTVLILTECSMLLEDLELRGDKNFPKDTSLEIRLKIMSRE